MKNKLFIFFVTFLCFHIFAQNIKIPENIEIIKDVVYGEVDGIKLYLDIVKPKMNYSKMPAIVFIHGGGWKSGDKNSGIFRLIPFAQKGYFCVSINYRLSGIAKFPAQIEDCKCAIRFLRANFEKYNIDPDKIGVWGTSAGGHLASLLGTTADIKEFEGKGGWEGYSSKVNAVCDWFGPSDFLVGFEKSEKIGSPYAVISELLGGPIEELKEKARKASPVYYVNKNCPPFLIMHGDKDNVVPFIQSQILYEKLKENNVPVTLVKIKDAGHGIGFKKEVMDFVFAFFDYYLKGEKEKWQKLTEDKSFIEIP